MINQISTSNTFAQWLTATQALIDKQNYVEDSANVVSDTANSIVIFVSDSTNTINAIASDAANTINVSVSNSQNTINISINSSTNTINAAVNTAVNTIVSLTGDYSNTANLVFDTANDVIAVAASVYTTSNNVNTAANSVFSYVGSAYDTANTVIVISQNAYDQANAAINLIFNVIDDTSSNTNEYYPALSNVTTGIPQDFYVSSTKLYYNPSTGQLNATSFNSLSDLNKKTDIHTIEESIDKVLNLRGVTFRWKDSGEMSIGVIAQEIEAILPEVVMTNSKGEKSVSYGNIIGLLIEAIKDQQKQLDDIKKLLNKQ